jgi:hypothetical protein
MDEKIVEQILDELFASFQKLEADSAAILLLLEHEGIATKERLAPYLEQSSRMSEVRWRAARVRMGALLGSAMKTAEPPAEKEKRTTPVPEEEKTKPEEKVQSKAGVEAKKESETKAKSPENANAQAEAKSKPEQKPETVPQSAASSKDGVRPVKEKPEEPDKANRPPAEKPVK